VNPKKGRFSVLVADDHPVYRHGLVDAIRRRPELELAGEAETGDQALAAMRSLNPDVTVVDMKMPGLDGLDVAKEAARSGVGSHIIFLSAYLDSATIYEAVEAGARGYLSKDSDADAICDAIVRVARGETVMGVETQRAIAEEIRMRAPAEPSPLSQREREILRFTAAGESATDIAARLFLSPATVKTHLQRIYQKLGVSDRAAAVAEAMRRGLLE
jgi:two-component system nitrate/nitrite response regulator NarL